MYFVRFSACFELRERDWDLLNRSFISNHYNQSGTRLYLGLSLPRLFWRGGPGSKVSRLVLVFWKRQLWYTKHIAYYQKPLNSYLCKVLYWITKKTIRLNETKFDPTLCAKLSYAPTNLKLPNICSTYQENFSLFSPIAFFQLVWPRRIHDTRVDSRFSLSVRPLWP